MTGAVSLLLLSLGSTPGAPADGPPRWSVEPGSYVGRDPAEQTKPLVDLVCKVADRSRKWQQIRLRIIGGQGFYQEPEFPGSSYVRVTTRFLKIAQDKAGVFAGAVRSGKLETGLAKFARSDGRNTRVKFDPYGSFDVITIAREHPTDYAGPPIAIHTGFCQARATPQQPLTPEETGALLKACPKARCI